MAKLGMLLSVSLVVILLLLVEVRSPRAVFPNQINHFFLRSARTYVLIKLC
jgi:hypothetical protein